MQFLKPRQLKEAFLRLRSESISMRRRFAAYVLMQLCALIALALLLLSLFDVLGLADSRLEQRLDHQLESSAATIESDIDTLAAYAIIFSEQMTALMERELAGVGLSFDELKNKPEALTVLQSSAYLTVYNNMRIAPCSGAFYFLDTTVNDSLAEKYYNGLYLKVANLFSDNTIHNEACLYRGTASVARENDINLHSTWQNETAAGVFAEIDELMEQSVDNLPKSYLLTRVYALPDSWENARYLCIPILDVEGNTMGVCGFEISDLFFKLSHKTVDMENEYIISALLERDGDGYTGQISGSQSGFTPPVDGVYSIEAGKRFDVIRCGDMVFYGKSKEITVGGTPHTLVAMQLKARYESSVAQVRLKATAILGIILAVTLFSCLWLSKRYVAPILKGLEQLKADPQDREPSRVLEINDLFDFLAQKEMENEARLRQLASEKEGAQREHEKAQMEISRLAYSRKQEIDPDQYQHFLDCLHTLTPTERAMFDYYLDGKSGKEIMAIMGIKESTLKWHNGHIYDKLGVSSRRELLRYAALMKQEEGGKAEK